MNEETVSIPKSKYEQLVRDSNWLASLENAGVDNWDGISFAHQLHTEEHGEGHL